MVAVWAALMHSGIMTVQALRARSVLGEAAPAAKMPIGEAGMGWPIQVSLPTRQYDVDADGHYALIDYSRPWIRVGLCFQDAMLLAVDECLMAFMLLGIAIAYRPIIGIMEVIDNRFVWKAVALWLVMTGFVVADLSTVPA